MAFNIVLRKWNGFSESVMDYFKTWAPWFKMMNCSNGVCKLSQPPVLLNKETEGSQSHCAKQVIFEKIFASALVLRSPLP